MNKMFFPDYNNCITSIPNSIMNYYGLKPYHDTNKIIDDYLKKYNPQNVVVILFDGMGYNLLKRKLKDDSFLIKNLKGYLTSVAPSTTTAATTSIMSGLNPVEHNWLGWDCYVPPIDTIVTMFLNTKKNPKEQVADYVVCRRYFNYSTVAQRINKETKYKAYENIPFGIDAYKSIDDMNKNILKKCQNKGKKYIYAYYLEPDWLMHLNGTEDIKVNNTFSLINKKVEELSNKLNDTLIIVTADHGHLNCQQILLSDYPKLINTLDGNVWLEGRMCSFRIKNGMKKKFVSLFNKYFKNDFILKTKEEIINSQIFGDGKENKYYRDSLGDYIALASSDKYFSFQAEEKNLKSVHAGFSEDEMKIPLILFHCEKNS